MGYAAGFNAVTTPCPNAEWRAIAGGLVPPNGAPATNFVQSLSYPSGTSSWTVGWDSAVNTGSGAATAFVTCLRLAG